MKSAVSLGIAATILALMFIAPGCDRATDPVVIDKGFNFLLHNRCCVRNFFVFNTKERTITDSFMLPEVGLPPELSADGRLIYVPAESLLVYNLATKALEFSLPYRFAIDVSSSSDNVHLAVLDRDSGLYVLTVPTYDVKFRNTVPGIGARFSSDGSELYYWDYTVLWRYAISDTIGLIDSFVRPLGINGQIRGDPSREKLYSYALDPYGPINVVQFEVYDMKTWTRTFVFPVSAGQGGLALSPDGRFAFFTNSGGLIGPTGDQKIRVYSSEDDSIIAEIETLLQIPGTPQGTPGLMRVSPDSRWLVAASAPAGGNVTLIDLESMQLDTIINLGNRNHSVLWITVHK
ncbi:MAG: hypothetical protein IH914_07090 [candidate division Zixibacteria bacterium]|nr:hypothetical protein [candidate division Zixibacteria bacterium]